MPEEPPASPNTVFIGNKGVTGYAIAAITLLQTHKEILLKARGRAISHCVDVCEVLRNRFFVGKCAIKEIKTGTEAVTTREGRASNISSIEIIMVRLD